MENNKQPSQFAEEELKEMRQEVLKWIEKKEKKKSPRAVIKKVKKKIKPPLKPKLKMKLKFISKSPAKPKTIKLKKKPYQLPLPKIFKKSLTKKILLVFFSLILLFLIIMTWGIYSRGWHGNFTIFIAKIIPYPAIFINDQVLKYSDYAFNLNTLLYFNSQQNQNNKLKEEEIKKKVIDKMVADAIIFELAEDYKVSITNEDLEQSLQSLIKETGSVQNFEKILKSLYSWRPADFKEKVLKPYLFQQRLLAKLKNDPATQEKIESQLKDILEMINNKELTFAEAAQTYSHDITAKAGGEMGYISKGQLNPKIEDLLFNLEAGEVSDVIKTDTGYYIFKVEEVIREKTKATEGEAVEAEEAGEVVSVKARQIFINPDYILNELIAEKNAQAKVRVLVR